MSDVRIPFEHFDGALLDLDGVVYVGESAVAHAVSSIEGARTRGMRFAYVTNNASRTPAEVSAHLAKLGLTVGDSEVVTSAQAGAHALERLLEDRGEIGCILAVGGPGVAAALRERGLKVTDRAEDEPVAVLQGFGRDIAWPDLAEASFVVGRGVPWVATNPDTSIPTPHGRAPGNGAFVQAVSLATGRRPDLVAGKPHRPLIDESLERLGVDRALMIGDRLDTDIEAGVNAGISTLLVMTGVTDVVDVLLAPPRQQPNFISLDLRGLHHDYPPVIGDGGHWRCGPVNVASGAGIGDFHVMVNDRSLGIFNGDDAGHPTIDDPVAWSAVMRCLAAAVWQWRDDQGKPDSAPTAGRGVDSDEDLRSTIANVPAVAALQGSVDRLRRVAEE